MNLDDRAHRAAAQLNAAAEERPFGVGLPRPRRQGMRVALAAASAVAVAAAGFVVLRDNDPARDQSVTAADRPGPGGEAAPPTGGGLPAGWARCTDDAARFSVGYPEGWYTIAKLPKDAVDEQVEVGPCRFFDPQPFEIVYASEWPTTALEVTAPGTDYSQLSKRPDDTPGERILRWEPETVGDRPAIRVERDFTGEGLYAAGLRYYGWIIDRDGEAFTVGGFWWSGETISRADHQAVVDRAVETLRFESSDDAAAPARHDPARRTAEIPVDLDSVPETGLALTGGGNPDDAADDEVVLVRFDGTELGRGPLAGWGADPATPVDAFPSGDGVVLAPRAPIDDSVPGCENPNAGGGVRVAVCPPLGERGGATEIHRVGSDGTRTKMAGPFDERVGHWRFALPSPDGKWLLAQWSAECEVPIAFLIEVSTGRRRPVGSTETAESWALGWAPDGRAAVSFGARPCGASDDRPGTYLLDPATGQRRLLHRYNHVSNSAYRFIYSPIFGSRLENLFFRAISELGLEGCCGDASPGSGSTSGFVLDGHEIFVEGRPLSDPPEWSDPGDLQVICGQARWTFSWFDEGEPDRRFLQDAADLLLSRLYCTRDG